MSYRVRRHRMGSSHVLFIPREVKIVALASRCDMLQPARNSRVGREKARNHRELRSEGDVDW